MDGGGGRAMTGGVQSATMKHIVHKKNKLFSLRMGSVVQVPLNSHFLFPPKKLMNQTKEKSHVCVVTKRTSRDEFGSPKEE